MKQTHVQLSVVSAILNTMKCTEIQIDPLLRECSHSTGHSTPHCRTQDHGIKAQDYLFLWNVLSNYESHYPGESLQ